MRKRGKKGRERKKRENQIAARPIYADVDVDAGIDTAVSNFSAQCYRRYDVTQHRRVGRGVEILKSGGT